MIWNLLLNIPGLLLLRLEMLNYSELSIQRIKLNLLSNISEKPTTPSNGVEQVR